MQKSRSALLAAAAMGMFASIGGMGSAQPTAEMEIRGEGTQSNNASKSRPSAPDLTTQRLMNAIMGGMGVTRNRPYRKGPGWSHAQVQRMARKRRNKTKNRQNHR